MPKMSALNEDLTLGEIKARCIITENGCWIWPRTYRNGYGRISIRKHYHLMHRITYAKANGSIPKGFEIDHFVCNNRPCCNPEHLKATSSRDNNLRSGGCAAINARKTHCKRGHPLSGKNLVSGIYDGTAYRRCRICTNAANSRNSKARFAKFTPKQMAAHNAKGARWRALNPEKSKAMGLRYHYKNKEKRNAYARAYYHRRKAMSVISP